MTMMRIMMRIMISNPGLAKLQLHRGAHDRTRPGITRFSRRYPSVLFCDDHVCSVNLFDSSVCVAALPPPAELSPNVIMCPRLQMLLLPEEVPRPHPGPKESNVYTEGSVFCLLSHHSPAGSPPNVIRPRLQLLFAT